MNWKVLIFIALWILSVLFSTGATSFSFFDEALFIFIIADGVRNGLLWNKPFIIAVFYFISELVYSCFLPYNTFNALAQDMMMFSKAYLCAIACGEGFFSFDKNGLRNISKYVSLLIPFFFLIAIVTLLMGRCGAHAKPFLLYHSNYELAHSVSLTVFLLLYCRMNRVSERIELKKNVFLYLLLLLIYPLSMQGKFYGVLSLFFIFLFYARYMYMTIFSKKKINRVLMKLMTVAIILSSIALVLFMAYDDFQLYYTQGNDNVARRMMIVSLPQVLDGSYLFAGRGFASYCSPIVTKYYSVFMDQIGLSSVFGLSRDYSAFMADGYYWSLLGELGIIGMMMYLLFLLYLIKPFYVLFRMKKLPGPLFFVFFLNFVWVIVFSFGSGGMFGLGLYVMIVLGLARNEANQLLKMNRCDFVNKET